jgi:hypothetical protein
MQRCRLACGWHARGCGGQIGPHGAAAVNETHATVWAAPHAMRATRLTPEDDCCDGTTHRAPERTAWSDPDPSVQFSRAGCGYVGD